MGHIVWPKLVSEGAKKGADIGLMTDGQSFFAVELCRLLFSRREASNQGKLHVVLCSGNTSHCVGSITVETARGAPPMISRSHEPCEVQ